MVELPHAIATDKTAQHFLKRQRSLMHWPNESVESINVPIAQKDFGAAESVAAKVIPYKDER